MRRDMNRWTGSGRVCKTSLGWFDTITVHLGGNSNTYNLHFTENKRVRVRIPVLPLIHGEYGVMAALKVEFRLELLVPVIGKLKGSGVMPREMIRDVAGLYDIHVGWSNQSVQLGLETSDGRSLIDVLSENYEETGKAKSVWSSLERDEINELIRKLRKARDRAFGADA